MFHLVPDSEVDTKELQTELYLEMIRRIKNAEKKYDELGISCEELSDKTDKTSIEECYLQQADVYALVIEYLEKTSIRDHSEKYVLMVQMLESSLLALELGAKCIKLEQD